MSKSFAHAESGVLRRMIASHRMVIAHCMLGLCAALAGVSTASAGENEPWDEYTKQINNRMGVGAMGPTLFGDQVSYYTGSLSFSNTDVSIPGNFALPVSVARTFTVTDRKSYDFNDLPFADWDLDLPNISGTFRSGGGPNCAATTVFEGAPPTIYVSGATFTADEYWHGNHASLPGGGGEMVLIGASTAKPSTGGPYYWIAGQTVFSCLPNSSGFLATTPDGTRYWLDKRAEYYEPEVVKHVDTGGGTPLKVTIARKRVVLYASRVEDRFGNWVTYSFSNATTSPAHLDSILSSDGRQITLGYDAYGHVASVNDGSHTWQYTYDYTNPAKGTLTSVRLPDNSSWTINFAAFGTTRINYLRDAPGDPWRDCLNPGDVANELTYTGVITHPSGAVGEFSVYPTRFGRTNVPKACGGYRSPPYTNPSVEYSYYPVEWDAIAISKKKVTGPGLPVMEWQYQFSSGGSFNENVTCSQANGCTPACVSDTCAGGMTAEVAGPDQQYTRYTFGSSFRYNEGKLLKVESGSIQGPLDNFTSPRTILKTETKAYELAQSGQAYPTPIGRSPQQKGDGFAGEFLSPLASTTIVQDGATFQSAVSMCGSIRCYDGFARATLVSNSSSLGYARTIGTEYEDTLSSWVIGQVKRTTINGAEAERTVYDAVSRLPLETYSFGKLQSKHTYNPDSTLATMRDGNNNVTTLSNWKRGIPQLVRHPVTPEAPAGATESALVNNDGTLAYLIDEAGSKTCYTYDAMGRITSVTYTSETTAGVCDASKWAVTTQSFTQISATEYGIPASHWRQDVATGNARKVTYFDGFWRPLVTWEYDAANVAGTQRFTRRAFNASGQESFVAYPGTTDALTTGMRTTYDPLGRVIRVDQDNELGTAPLTTTTEYLSGFLRRTTNPRGKATLEQFEAYEAPTYDAPRVIDAPQGVRTVIQRNIYGNPTSVTRSGPDG